MSALGSPDQVVDFWLSAGPDRWYRKDVQFDAEISEKLGDLHDAASRGELDAWSETPNGSLALLLLLDQCSRNLYRGRPQAFGQDAKARAIASAAIAAGFDHRVGAELRQFFYLPFMHSESIADQESCVTLCHGLPDRSTLSFARDHERIIRRFGRFPHRNNVLGRHTTPAERAFLEAGGFAG